MRRAPIPQRRAAVVAGLVASALAAAPAGAVDFAGRIGFTSFRVDPNASLQVGGDIFSMNPDGSDVRRLTTNPELDRQPDWSPGGTQIAYTIRKPGERVNFEVALMSSRGRGHRRLTTSAPGEASSQAAWFPSARGLLFRRSGPGRVASIWQLNRRGMNPMLRFQPPNPPLYPTFSPDEKQILFTAIMSPTGDTDRGIFVVNADGMGLKTLFDVAGAYDSGPAWSRDGRIAFESNASLPGAPNPEGDLEIWTMNADGSGAHPITRNAVHDEGPAWAPDGSDRIAFSSGADNEHLDIFVMDIDGDRRRQLTTFAGLDESPDWQPIPAPKTSRRCGDIESKGVYDLRTYGLGCLQSVFRLVQRWRKHPTAASIGAFKIKYTDFGGTQRVVWAGREQGRRRVVAFLFQPPPRGRP